LTVRQRGSGSPRRECAREIRCDWPPLFTRNLEDMQARIAAGHWHTLDEREWLERLASNYSDARRVHQPCARPAARRAAGLGHHVLLPGGWRG